MDVTQIISLLGALGGAGGIAALITALVTRRKVLSDASKSITDMFDSLCKSQAARIEQLTERIAANEAEIAELRQELEDSRNRERALQDRVTRLEAENATLKLELEERRKQTGRR